MAGISEPERRVRYGVAMSLDGYIAGPNGEDQLDHPGPRRRLRRDLQPLRHSADRPQDIRGDAEGGRWRRRVVARREVVRDLAKHETGRSSRRHDRDRRRRDREESEGRTRQGHLVVRGRRVVQEPPGLWTRGRRRHGNRSGVAWRGDSAGAVTSAADTTGAHEAPCVREVRDSSVGTTSCAETAASQKDARRISSSCTSRRSRSCRRVVPPD